MSSSDIFWQPHSVNQAYRENQKDQKSLCVWLTGLSGAGKSTVANLLEQRLVAKGKHTYLLDGDNLRHGLNRDLGFSEKDRSENIRRAAEVARLMTDAGLIVIASFISPFDAERKGARALFKEGCFREIYIKTSLAVCEARDPKGLYAKARAGALLNFTGIDSPYEEPESPDMTIESDRISASDAAAEILRMIEEWQRT